MRSLLVFFFGLVAVFSFVNVCEGTSSDDEVTGETSAYTTDTEVANEVIDSIAKEIENELEDAFEDMIVENEESNAVAGISEQNLPLMFPSLKSSGKSQRKTNKEMAVKVASIIEQAMMLVANDILQTTVLLQTDPEDFLQLVNTTSTTTSE